MEKEKVTVEMEMALKRTRLAGTSVIQYVSSVELLIALTVISLVIVLVSRKITDHE